MNTPEVNHYIVKSKTTICLGGARYYIRRSTTPAAQTAAHTNLGRWKGFVFPCSSQPPPPATPPLQSPVATARASRHYVVGCSAAVAYIRAGRGGQTRGV